MIQRGKKILLFPVETTVRELDFRLVLATLCARPDWQILLGDHDQLFRISLRLRNALFVGKNLIGGKYPWKYQRYRSQNIRSIQLPEEGGIFEGGKEDWKNALRGWWDVTEVEADDHVCTWGQFQKDFYLELGPKVANNIHVTGHPRFDLCRPRFKALYEDEAAAMKAKYGKFILINTNFLSNNGMGADINLRWFKIKPEETERRTFYIDQYCHDSHKQAHFVHLINELSNRCPDHHIIFRPHPSEDMRLFQSLFQYIPRVTVTREGSLQAWLHACEAMVHDGCTTAIEAHLTGANIINYQPLKDPRFDIVLPNLVGLPCTRPEQVADAIHAIARGNPAPSATPEALAQIAEMIANFEPGFDSFAALQQVISRCQDEVAPAQIIGAAPLHLKHRLTDPLSKFTRPSPRLRRLFHSKDRGFEKFPFFDPTKIRQRLDSISGITGKQVDVAFHGLKMLSITTGNARG